MTVANVRFFSEALGKWTRYNAILPDVGEGPYPVLMQLHGLSDDEDSWVERSNLVRYVGELPLIVVLPDGGTSGYLNWKTSERLHKHRYEDLLIHDIPNNVRHHFQVKDGPWAIGGLSMGGYGAMRLGLKYPDRFASIHAHSSAFHIHELVNPEVVEDLEDASVFLQAEALAKRGERPVITFDCGVDDRLLETNRRFHEHLQALDIDHTYAEFDGDHEWDYWDLHVQEALAQHARVLGLV
ncbi:MAG TPA: alpha/beta hydrolase family protein [Thermomicrobiales bacterium]|nr:alpha/beta hydrolase family protein [Thermomicrobiales bacterium]